MLFFYHSMLNCLVPANKSLSSKNNLNWIGVLPDSYGVRLSKEW